MKVPVIEISPCSAGLSVLAADAAIGADQSPASFEKTPRAIPFCIAIIIVDPANPPTAAVFVKADFIIVTIASGIAEIFIKIIIILIIM